VSERNAVLKRLGSFPARVMAWQGLDLLTPFFSPQVLITSTGKQCYLGFGSDYSIRAYSAVGRLERIIRREWKPEPVDMDELSTQWVKGDRTLTGSEAAARLKEIRQSPHAAVLPAFAQLFADRTNRLWVRESRVEDSSPNGILSNVPSRWSVFSSDGRWLSDVTMPARFLPADIGADYVLGVARDSDGVETVVMYGLGAG
jgi:hypothetical protein